MEGLVDSKLLGRWSRHSSIDGNTYFYEFKPDGTLKTNDLTGDGKTVECEYKALGNSIMVTLYHPNGQAGVGVINYSVNAFSLELSQPDGPTTNYTKS